MGNNDSNINELIAETKEHMTTEMKQASNNIIESYTTRLDNLTTDLRQTEK